MNHSSSKGLLDYYESNWKTLSGLQMSKEMADLGLTWCEQLPVGSCLDLGCGDGTNAIRLKKLGFDVVGCDIAENAVRKAKSKGINAKKIDLNTSDFPFKTNSSDLVWMSDVIEHIFWPDDLMDRVYKVLKRGGHLFLTTPNVSWYINRLQLLFGHTLHDIHPEHIRWFNFNDLESLLLAHHFKIEKIKAYRRLVPFPVSQRIKLLRNLDSVGDADNFFSYTYAVLVRK